MTGFDIQHVAISIVKHFVGYKITDHSNSRNDAFVAAISSSERMQQSMKLEFKQQRG